LEHNVAKKTVPLNEKNKNNLHIVFIEGVAATGKSTICKTLGSNGYTVRFEQFVELCEQNPMYSPEGSVLPTKWICAIFSSIEKFVKQYETDRQAFKDDLVFFDRSLLTPYIYTRGKLNNLFACDAMNEIRQVFNCSSILCEASEDVIRNRLQQRYNAGSPQEQEIRLKLGELNDEYQRSIAHRYEELKSEGWFDDTLDTSTDLLNATKNLLVKLGSKSNHNLLVK